MENNCVEIEKIEKKVHSIGVDITIIDSLVSFLDIGMDEEYELTGADIANLTTVIRKMTKILRIKFERLEHILNI